MSSIAADSLISNQVDVLNTPPVENMDEPTKFKEDERPCTIVALRYTSFSFWRRITGPSCRSPISKDKLFTRAAFEAVINDDTPGSSKLEGVGGGNEGDLDDPELELETRVNKAIELVPRFLPSTKMKVRRCSRI